MLRREKASLTTFCGFDVLLYNNRATLQEMEVIEFGFNLRLFTYGSTMAIARNKNQWNPWSPILRMRGEAPRAVFCTVVSVNNCCEEKVTF